MWCKYTSYFKYGRKWLNKRKEASIARGLKERIYEKVSETCIRHWRNFESFALRPTFLVRTFKAEHREVRRARFLKIQEYFSFMIFLSKLLPAIQERAILYIDFYGKVIYGTGEEKKRIETIYNSHEIYMHTTIWSIP